MKKAKTKRGIKKRGKEEVREKMRVKAEQVKKMRETKKKMGTLRHET